MKRGYNPKNYADSNEIDFVALGDKAIKDIACGF
jgi:hypothetical protein